MNDLNNITYGLLGEHLCHSYSPQIHALIGDYDYRLIELAREEALGFLKAHPFKAINVTIPYKIDAFNACDLLSNEAKAIGSVNTLVVRDGKLCGYNTDAYGFEYMLKRGGIDPRGKSAIVLGSGGASVTAVYVLKKLGASGVTVISRRGENNYENISRHHGAGIIVNTTPVGMFPGNGVSPIKLSGFKNCTGAVDLIYNPAKTRLILDAISLGIPAVSGLSMLVAQAKKAAEYFFDRRFEDSIIGEIEKKISSGMKNIALIGMPGCGKSTVGRKLKALTGRELVDTDEEIEKRTGRRIPEIIENDGESAFRQIERDVLTEISKQSGIIIACGGGIVTTAGNADLLRQNSTVFYIDRPISELETKGRPLSQSSGVETLYKARRPLYLKAADRVIPFESSDKCAEDILASIG